MAGPVIVITQGISVTTGVPNLDVVTGTPVTFSLTAAFGSYQWQLLSRPVNHSLVESGDSLVAPLTNPTVTITPTSKGTYKVRFVADGGIGVNKIAELWFYARNPGDPLVASTSTLPRRHPAYTEGSETGTRGAMTELDAWLYVIEDLWHVSFDPLVGAGGDLSGAVSNATVIRIQNIPVSVTAPTPSQVFVYDGVRWTPTTLNLTLLGDVTGTIGANTVASIRGLPTTDGLLAAIGEFAAVVYTPIWDQPSTIAFDGTSLWVGGTPASGTFVTKVNPGTFAHTNYALPTGTRPIKIITDVTHVFAVCLTGFGNQNKLVVLSVATGAVVGLGQFPPGFGSPTDLALDGLGFIWTADSTNGLQGFNIAAMLAAYPAPVLAAKTLALAGAHALASDGAAFLYASDGFGGNVYKVDPVVPAFVGLPYTDGLGRTINFLFYGGGVLGIVSVWATTGGAGNLLRINPTGMVLLADVPQGGTAGILGALTSDGTYIYTADQASDKIETFLPGAPGTAVWNSEVAAYPPATVTGGLAFDGAAVWGTFPSTTPTGQQGIASFTSFGPTGAFLVGPLALGYRTLAGDAIGAPDAVQVLGLTHVTSNLTITKGADATIDVVGGHKMILAPTSTGVDVSVAGQLTHILGSLTVDQNVLLGSTAAKPMLLPLKLTVNGVAGLFATTLTGFSAIGAIVFDPTLYFSGDAQITRTIKFSAVIESTGGATASIELYNVDTGLYVASSLLTTTSATASRQISGTLAVPADLPNSIQTYEVHLKRTGGLVTDTATCKMARLEVIYN